MVITLFRGVGKSPSIYSHRYCRQEQMILIELEFDFKSLILLILSYLVTY
jgi:hypothetical protein